ncbi:SMI1/KNR4 family protein [Tenacibaculum sp. M341]|uniref:SMI1/KNR4 family protein n=1 Tax=Tenacibaculum sp. M341 TaxID=2530339 RepID=UPI001051E38F|nr:SMI1/KNR4 family protein [Tenacibaculum sp. M341]TCI93734.1 hypothetical protein EYW44_04775 [Tenacibaculum sp. M341]
MTLTDKLLKIQNWTLNNYNYPTNSLSEKTDKSLFENIEALLEEKLPKEFIELYSRFNGEIGEETGILLGLEFMDLSEIISQLKQSRRYIKPQKKTLENPKKSNLILDKIVSHFKELKNNFQSWDRIEFNCSPISFGGPYLYKNNSDSNIIIEIGQKTDDIMKLCGELYEIEKATDNWDELEFKIFSDYKYEIIRKNEDWDTIMEFKSYPPKSILLKYFHYKWLPVFTDGGGNYLGIDLAPDIQGKKGQIIIFGRDEALMPVLAENLSSFFDLCLLKIENNPELFNSENHQHEILKSIVGAPYEFLQE